MDASDPKDSEAAVELAVKRFGGIDFLVPAAAIYLARPAKEMSDAEWHKVISINLDGVFYICQRSIRALRENSAICNIASVAGHRGSFANSHYSATKGAILSLTRSLARELGPRTRVNAVSPGIIETPMTTELIKLRGADSIEQSSLKRLGQPAEVATAIAFLCSSGASFITGESLQVNGGLHIS
jgi:3-oxoacyl-[acyl-carrier protein] reductase